MADVIKIFTPSPADISLDDAEEIAKLIRAIKPNFDVQIECHERTGKGVTLYEILYIGLMFAGVGIAKAASEEAIKKIGAEIADAAVSWAQERCKKRKSKRGVYIKIYGPDGTVKSVVVRNEIDVPEDRTEQDRQLEQNIKKKS